MIKAYLDSYDKITVEVSKNYYDGKISSLFLLTDYGPEFLGDLLYVEEEKNFKRYTLKMEMDIELGKEYYLIDEYGYKFILEYRYIVKTYKFQNDTFTNEYLGCKYSPASTSFSLWAPISSEAILVINDMDYYKMIKENSVYKLSVKQDLNKCEYYFMVKNNGVYHKVLDPYCYSYNFTQTAGVVVDIRGYKNNNKIISKNSKVIYEVNVRDFSSSQKIKHKKKFLGIIEDENLQYLDNLGVEYVQFMPINYFNGDIYNNDNFYNWGYNPCLFGVPHPNYVYNLENPYAIIDECREMIAALHSRGIKVSLDVVFNHLENREDNILNVIVPYYYYLMDGEKLSNGSFCGIDLDSKAPMMNRFIKDICKRWITLYNVDAFRFDLMGILDCGTINELYEELKQIKDNIFIYGEGWNMPSLMKDEEKAIMTNASKIKNVAFFNDYYRESLKYDYVGENVIKGNYLLDNKLYFNFDKSINYLECHDNYTYYDLQKYVELREEKFLIKRQIFKNIVILLSNGYAYFHSGQEFFRTKKGCENSYRSLDDINTFDWNRMYKYTKEVNLIERIVKIREKYNLFSEEYEYEEDDGVVFLKSRNIEVVMNISDKVIKIDNNRNVLIATNKDKLEKFDLVIYRSKGVR